MFECVFPSTQGRFSDTKLPRLNPWLSPFSLLAPRRFLPEVAFFCLVDKGMHLGIGPAKRRQIDHCPFGNPVVVKNGDVLPTEIQGADNALWPHRIAFNPG